MLINLDGVSLTNKPRTDGRYQGYVTDDSGHKQYFYGRTYAETAAKIKSYLQEGKLPKKKVKKKSSPLFGEYVANWIEVYKKPNLKPKSIAGLQMALKPALQRFGNMPLDRISDDEVQRLLLSIPAPRVRSLCKLYLQAVFKKAVVTNVIKRNPCEAVELKNHKTKHISALTVDEQRIFFAAAEKTRYSLLFRFITMTGLRIGETLALHRSDIDFDKSTVHVNKNVVFIGGEHIEQDTPKSEAGNRTVPVPKSICTELATIETDLLFPFSYNAVQCSIKRLSADIGFKVTPHKLRHTYATRLEEACVPPKIKQYLLGHASLEMTQNVYTDVQSKYLETLAEKLRDIFE